MTVSFLFAEIWMDFTGRYVVRSEVSPSIAGGMTGV